MKKGIQLAEIFVDDIIFIGNDALCKSFIDQTRQDFEMSMFGEIKFFVGLQVYQTKKGIYINKLKYIKEILNFFGMDESRPIGTPMATVHKLSKNNDSVDVNKTLYRSMIGKLQYAHRKPYISLAVGIVAIFFANPKENHMMVVKRILRYLKGIEDYGLYYKKNENYELKVYTNAYWDGNVDDRNSTSGGAFFLGKRLVSWTSKKKNCIPI